jgi:hypothetical protein
MARRAHQNHYVLFRNNQLVIQREKQPDNKPIFINYYVKSIDRFGKTASDYPAKFAPEGQKAAVFNHLRQYKSNTAPDSWRFFNTFGGFMSALRAAVKK